MEDKEFLNTLKAIFYQLFSRKLNFVVFTGDPNKRDQLLFSNVDNETMLIYDESPEYHYAKVQIKDNEFLDYFYKKFPLLLNNSSIIRVVDFCSPLSKAENLKDVTLEAVGETLQITYPMKSTLDENLVIKEEKDVGFILPPVEVDMYYIIWKSGLVTSEDPFHKVMQSSDITNEKGASVDNKVEVIQDIAHPTEKFRSQHAMIILQPGFTVPTLPAFLKVTKNQKSTFELVAGYDKNSVIVNCIYDTDLLMSVGTHPAQRWFVKDKR